jgi:nucleoid-associated protein YgaU
LFDALTCERPFDMLPNVCTPLGTESNLGGHPVPAAIPRCGDCWRRSAGVCLFSLGFALAARGGAEPGYTTVVVQPGDSLWSIASEHYPDDDVRVRVDDIEQANGLDGPTIEVGRTLRLPS